MKINKCIIYNSKPEYFKAIQEVMTLFGIHDCEIAKNVNLPNIEAHVVLVKNCIVKRITELEVVSTVVYQVDNKLTEVSKTASANYQDDNAEKITKRLLKLNIFTIMREITGYKLAKWGILRGVRPTKIIHKMLDNGLGPADAVKNIMHDYGVDIDKAKLVTEVALNQRLVLPNLHAAKRSISIYIGIPFCPSRCLYCSFPGYVLPDKEQVAKFLATLTLEIQDTVQLIKKYELTVQSVYIGGGTPTSLDNDDFAFLINLVKNSFVTDDIEFTVEAGRPDSINNSKISTMCEHNVTRISINPQTMQQKTLNRIGRKHSVQDIINIFGKIRQFGIPIINMDVIVGLPGENETDIVNTMEQVAKLKPDNLTIHTLALKKGSILKTNLNNYLLPDEITTINMHNIACKYANEMHLQPYYLYRQKYMAGNLENIGYARKGTECLYNILVMEERQTIIGLGPAASTKAVDVNTWHLESHYNAKDLHTYIKNLDIYMAERTKLLSTVFE